MNRMSDRPTLAVPQADGDRRDEGASSVRISRPGDGPIFAIGDIHGCAAELRELVSRLPLTVDSTLVFLGDYVDRGPRSREVIEFLLELRDLYHVITLMGNHEELFLAFLEQPGSVKAAEFVMHGGSATLASYANDIGQYEIPPSHQAFLRELPILFQTDRHFFVHAGVPDIPLEQVDQTLHRHDLLWIRRSFLHSGFRWSKTVVHGHTPSPEVQLTSSRIGVDTGCVFGGHLSAVDVDKRLVYSVRRRAVDQPVYLRDRSSQRRAVRFEGTVPVHVEGAPLDFVFETVNYSEIGMLIRQLHPQGRSIFANGQVLRGAVGSTTDTRIAFEGQVLRRVIRDGMPYYAIEILQKSV